MWSKIMRYDLLDIETGNLYGRFRTEDEALAFVRSLVDANGPAIAETLALGGRDDAGRVLATRTGTELTRRAEETATDWVPMARRA
jgi:hypothetical protein